MKKYRVTIDVEADEAMGWSALTLKSLFEDAAYEYGDLKAEVRVALVVPPAPIICQNCGGEDPDNDHWDDLDGPNRAGWICSSQVRRPTLAEETRAVMKKLGR